MNRGEVWWFDEPHVGRRPVCVLTRSEAIPVLKRVTVAPATRTIREIATEVELDRDHGMPDRCVLSLDNVRTVPKALLTERVTVLAAARLEQVCRALDHALAC